MNTSSSRFARAALWASVLVLIAGFVAFIMMRVASSDESNVGATPRAQTSTIDGTDYPPTPTATKPKPGDVPKAVQKVAGEFVLAAAGREDLKKAWDLSHPELKKACGCTYEQWLTGNIPVQYYPTNGLRGATFAVNEVTPGHVILEVMLVPKKGSEVPAQAFYIGLRQVGGKSGKWLVDYWAPDLVLPVPNVG